jgi:hypothetical protein
MLLELVFRMSRDVLWKVKRSFATKSESALT